MNYAGFWIRAVAMLIDLMIMGTVYFVIMLIPGVNFLTENIIYQILCMGYFVFLTQSSFRGTIGQYAMRIRIGDTSDNKLSYIQSVARYVVCFLPCIPLIFYSFTDHFVRAMDFAETINSNDNMSQEEAQALLQSPEFMQLQEMLGLSGILAALALVLGLIWVLPIVFTDQKKALHDMILKQRAFIKVRKKA